MKPINQKHKTNEKIERNPTEPVVEGLRSDCCGAMTEQIFLEILLLHLGIENCDDVENAMNPKSFCKKKKKTQKNFRNGFYWNLTKWGNGNWENVLTLLEMKDAGFGAMVEEAMLFIVVKNLLYFFSKENITY